MNLRQRILLAQSDEAPPRVVAPVRPHAGVDVKAPLEMAIAFLEERKLDTVFWQGTFWRFVGTHYEELKPEALRPDVYAWLQGRTTEDGEAIRPNKALVDRFIDALQAAAFVRGVAEAPAWMRGTGPRPDELIACTNGVLHIPTRSLIREPTRDFFNMNAVSFAWDEDAPDPVEWLSFLAAVWPDDEESIRTLQEVFGLVLTADTSQQKAFLLIGPKRSGKGTIARVLTELVGRGNHVAPTFAGLGERFGLESFIGKRLAIVSDARLGGKADIAAIAENLLRITGEDSVSVQRKHRTDWTAKLQVRFLILSNEVPALFDQSGALASRFIVLRMTESFFGKEDLGLTAKLLQELPGIFLWALDGLDRLRARGHFIQPQSAQETLRQLEMLGSPIKAFAEEKCVLAAGAAVPFGDLFSEWQRWCAANGRETGSSAIFGKNLSAAFPALKVTQPRTAAGKRFRQLEGIRLRTLADDAGGNADAR